MPRRSVFMSVSFLVLLGLLAGADPAAAQTIAPAVSFYRNTELIMFDIRLNDEQRAFQQLAREFAEKEIKPIALDLDSRPNWEDRIPWERPKKGLPTWF